MMVLAASGWMTFVKKIKSYATWLKLHISAISSAFAPEIHGCTKTKRGYRQREDRGVKGATDPAPKRNFFQMKIMFGDTDERKRAPALGSPISPVVPCTCAFLNQHYVPIEELAKCDG